MNNTQNNINPQPIEDEESIDVNFANSNTNDESDKQQQQVKPTDQPFTTNGTTTADPIDLDSDSDMTNDNKILETPSEIIDMTEGDQQPIIEDIESLEEEEEEDGEDDDDEVEVVNDTKVNGKPRIPLANDFDALAKKLMKTIPDYPVKEQTHYVWEIPDWNKVLKEEKVRSPTFKCGGFEWNILLFPRGNNQNNTISIYIEPHPPSDATDDWYVCAQFGLDLWNPIHPDAHHPSQSYHRFSKAETDWGFSSLMDLKQLMMSKRIAGNSSQNAILENNQLNITAFLKVIDDFSTGVLWHQFLDYDSKKNSGYVGLNNQGATCYLNSLLQSYFSTKWFRKLVYQIPTSVNDKNIQVPLSLQRIFYLLSNSNDPVGTLELTKSFGWDTSDAFTQHDVQELNRILMDKLETAMKGTPIENKLNDIFVGKMKSYIKCVNVPYESSRVEDFWDIQLNVKGFKNLKESFNNYIEIEMLDGENKYQAGEDYGYQDAKKGVVFESFPPALHLQLKRFEYDFMVDDLVKIDDFYEFPDKIDLKPYLDEDLPNDVLNENWNYKLHGVLVHQGTISNGHYYAMIKPNSNDNTWLRFDDDKVWKVTHNEVFKENFGALDLTTDQLNKLTRTEQQEHFMRKVTSAYMLVYYRESELNNILPDDEESITQAIPAHVPQQIQSEIEEKERIERERQEALYYTNAKIITVSEFNNHDQFDYAIDYTNERLYDKSQGGYKSEPLSIKIKKDSTFLELKQIVGEKLGYKDLSGVRLVPVCHRSNSTNRLDYPISEEKLAKLTIQSIHNKFFNRRYDELMFFAEESNKDLANVNELVKSKEVIQPNDFSFQTVKNKIEQVGSIQNESGNFATMNEYSQIMTILIKYFDPLSQKVQGLSHITVSRSYTLDSINDTVLSFLQFPKTTNLEFYEEVNFRTTELLDPTKTFSKSEINHGDIIVVQVKDPHLYLDKKFQTAKEYFKFLYTRVHIRVKPCKLEIDEEDSDVVQKDNEEDREESVDTEIEIAKNISKSFDLWISTLYNYQALAKDIADRLNYDYEYLRLFVLTGQGHRIPLKSTMNLSQLFTKPMSVSQIVDMEYEILTIKYKEYENLKSIKIHWLNTLMQSQTFDILVSKTGTIHDLVTKLISKVGEVSPQSLKHLLIYSGQNHTFNEIVRYDSSIMEFADDTEFYCGIFPAEVEVLVKHDMFKRFVDEEPMQEEGEMADFLKLEYEAAKKNYNNLNLIPAFHFYKNASYHHGIPFIFIVIPSESFPDTKERLRQKLGLGKQAFDKLRIAVADAQNRGSYLDESNPELNLYHETGQNKRNNLAIDSPDRGPKRQNQFDKGISIK